MNIYSSTHSTSLRIRHSIGTWPNTAPVPHTRAAAPVVDSRSLYRS